MRWRGPNHHEVVGPPPLRLALAGARGGQGTTTVAVVLAMLAAARRPTALVATRPEDACAVAAARSPVDEADRVALAPGLVLEPAVCRTRSHAEITIADLGRCDEIEPGAPAPGTEVRWLVLRGPCYTSLRAAGMANWRADGVILLAEAGRAITAVDVADVLGLPVLARVPVEAPVARVVDAGLLRDHLGRLAAFACLARLLDHQLTSTTVR